LFPPAGVLETPNYRVSKERFPLVTDVKACIQQEWLEQVRAHFNGMYADWKKTWG